MMQDQEMDRVLLAIFSASGLKPGFAALDEDWLAKLRHELRQSALETHLASLAGLGFIRRGPGNAAVTAKGLDYIYRHTEKWRNLASTT